MNFPRSKIVLSGGETTMGSWSFSKELLGEKGIFVRESFEGILELRTKIEKTDSSNISILCELENLSNSSIYLEKIVVLENLPFDEIKNISFEQNCPDFHLQANSKLSFSKEIFVK